MSDNDENRSLFMMRPDLNDIPEVPFPSGYRLRALHDGRDAEIWLSLIRAAEKIGVIEDDTFQRAYGNDDSQISERVYFLEDASGTPIGTVGAWYGVGDRSDWGRIHWLYIFPEYQGCGLGKALLAFALQRLRSLGHTCAYLKTSTGRPNAVHLYRAFGFTEMDDT